jgi:hypothetical protein
MAINDIVTVTTNAGTVPAVVLAQYDTDGVVTATDNDVVTADLLLLGQANAQRTLAKDDTDPYTVNTFTFTGANS